MNNGRSFKAPSNRQALRQWVRPPLRTAVFLNNLFGIITTVLLMLALHVLGSLPPNVRFKWNSWLVILTWPSPNCRSLEGN